HRVGAGLAFDRVAAVAGIPDEVVVSSAQLCDVAAAVAVDGVVSGPAAQRLVSFAAGDRVVSVSTVQRRWGAVGEGAVALVEADEIVARAGLDDDVRDGCLFEAQVG